MDFGKGIKKNCPQQRAENSKKYDSYFDYLSELIKDVSLEKTGKCKNEDILESHVLTWRVEQIANSCLFVDKVEWIPETFRSLEAYLESFIMPLIEECRAKLQQSLETVSTLPCSRVQNQELKTIPGSIDDFHNLFFTVVEDQTTLGVKLKPTDLILLSSLKPQHIDDLLIPGFFYTLGVLRGSNSAECNSNQLLNAFLFAPKGGPEYNALTDKKTTWYLTVVDSLATSLRIWSALQNPLKQLKESGDDFIPTSLEIMKEVICDQIGENVNKVTNDVKVNDFQKTCLSMIGSTPNFHILAEAPKASGKSFCALLALLKQINENSKISQALCLCATQELVEKSQSLLRQLAVSSSTSVTSNFIYLFSDSSHKLLESPVIIGTPGKIKRWITQGKLSVKNISLVVFDDITTIFEKEGYYDDSLRLLRRFTGAKSECQFLLLATKLNHELEKFTLQLTKQLYHISFSPNGFIKGEVISTDDSLFWCKISDEQKSEGNKMSLEDVEESDPPLSKSDQILAENAQVYGTNYGLNDYQMKAISRVLKGLLYRSVEYRDCISKKFNDEDSKSVYWKKQVQLIQGPPGTGKTSTVATLLSIVCSSGFRAVVSAPTNVAVSEIALRFLKYFDNIGQSQFGDFLNEQKLSGGGLRKFKSPRKGDVAMIGNEERIPVNGPLGDIFFGPFTENDRTKRLYKALNLRTGWAATAKSALTLLEFGLLEYDKYLKDIEVEMGEKGNTIVERVVQVAKEPSLLDFFRDKFKPLAQQMKACGRSLCFDLPSAFLCDNDCEKILKAVDAANSILKLILLRNVSSAEFESWLTESSNCKASNVERAKEKLTTKFGNRSMFFQELRSNLYEALKSEPGFAIREIPVNSSKDKITLKCLSRVSLLFCTTSSAGKFLVREAGKFDLLLVDEAAQLVEAESIIGLQIWGIKQTVLVGDPKQLPATIISQVSNQKGYGRSLFERLQKNGYKSVLLGVQYRMNPSISHWPCKYFYDGKVEDGPNVIKAERHRSYQEKLFGAYAFINVSEGLEKREGTSIYNDVEAAVVAHLVERLRIECNNSGTQGTDVGLITPYTSQVEELEKQLQSLSLTKLDSNLKVEVKSVDGFQGRERDVIIFSAVRANPEGKIGFLSDKRRLNVAITRGRHVVWIVGHSLTLCTGDTTWRNLIEDARKRGFFFEASDDPGISKVIQKAKQKLGDDKG